MVTSPALIAVSRYLESFFDLTVHANFGQIVAVGEFRGSVVSVYVSDLGGRSFKIRVFVSGSEAQPLPVAKGNGRKRQTRYTLDERSYDATYYSASFSGRSSLTEAKDWLTRFILK